MDLINLYQIDRHIIAATTRYSKECPQLCEYLEDVYARLQHGGAGIDLAEIRFIGQLVEKDNDDMNWYTPQMARNSFHHFAHDFGLAKKWEARQGWALIADA